MLIDKLGENTNVVWDAIKNLAPQLDKLQHKEETIAAEFVKNSGQRLEQI